MKQLVAVVFLLCAYHSQAQSGQQVNRESFFYSIYSTQLHEVRRPDSLARLTHALQAIDQLPSANLPASYFASGRYRLLYVHTFGWREYVARPRTNSDRTFRGDATGNLVTGQELFRLLGLPGNDSVILREYPLVLRREDTYNRRWTPISRSARYLVLRRVFSYPDGNAASWYSEQRYYFERVN